MDNLSVNCHRYAKSLLILCHFRFIGSITYNSHAALMWNLALDGSGHPELPSSNSCGGGCRGVVQINSDGSWSVNQECEFADASQLFDLSIEFFFAL